MGAPEERSVTHQNIRSHPPGGVTQSGRQSSDAVFCTDRRTGGQTRTHQDCRPSSSSGGKKNSLHESCWSLRACVTPLIPNAP